MVIGFVGFCVLFLVYDMRRNNCIAVGVNGNSTALDVGIIVFALPIDGTALVFNLFLAPRDDVVRF